jgi:hypothetical protein
MKSLGKKSVGARLEPWQRQVDAVALAVAKPNGEAPPETLPKAMSWPID